VRIALSSVPQLHVAELGAASQFAFVDCKNGVGALQHKGAVAKAAANTSCNAPYRRWGWGRSDPRLREAKRGMQGFLTSQLNDSLFGPGSLRAGCVPPASIDAPDEPAGVAEQLVDHPQGEETGQTMDMQLVGWKMEAGAINLLNRM